MASSILTLSLGLCLIGPIRAEKHYIIDCDTYSNDEQQSSLFDDTAMFRAYQIALDGSPWAAVIYETETGLIVAEGQNDASLNPILHGETQAFMNWSRIIEEEYKGTKSVYELAPNYTLVTTQEPCPMCSGAIGWSQFGRVVWGTSVKYLLNRGYKQSVMSANMIFPSFVQNGVPTTNIPIIPCVLHSLTDTLFETYLAEEANENEKDSK